MNQSKKGIAEEKKRLKAKNLRYKKPIVKDINFDKITEDLWYITKQDILVVIPQGKHCVL